MSRFIDTPLFKRGGNKRRWPEPECSIGEYIGKIGSADCWYAIGPAQDLWDPLALEIKEYLEKSIDEIPSSRQVTWSMYMIGATRQTAVPTIMFLGEEPGPRKEMRKAIKESRILDKYPGVKTGEKAVGPEFVHLEQHAADTLIDYPQSPVSETRQMTESSITFFDNGPDSRKELSKATKESGVLDKNSDVTAGDVAQNSGVDGLDLSAILSTADHRQIATTEERKPVLYNSSQGCIYHYGMQVSVPHHEHSSMKSATAGGIVRFQDRLFYFTVAHAFQGSMLSACEQASRYDDNYEIDSDDDTCGSEVISTEHLDATSLGSISPKHTYSPESDSLDDDGSSNVSADVRASPHISLVNTSQTDVTIDSSIALRQKLPRACSDSSMAYGITTPPSLAVIGELVFISTDKDYALIEIKKSNVRVSHSYVNLGASSFRPKQVAVPGPEGAEVVTLTASGGLLTGRLSGTPSYTRLPNARAFEQVYTVRLKGPLLAGDCGSWIVDARTSDLYGYIVAGCSTTGAAYVMAFHHVFEDVQERIGGKLILPANCDCESQEHEANEYSLSRDVIDLNSNIYSPLEEPALPQSRRNISELPDFELTDVELPFNVSASLRGIGGRYCLPPRSWVETHIESISAPELVGLEHGRECVCWRCFQACLQLRDDPLRFITDFIRPDVRDGQTREQRLDAYLKKHVAGSVKGEMTIELTCGYGPSIRVPHVVSITLRERGMHRTPHYTVDPIGDGIHPVEMDSFPAIYTRGISEIYSLWDSFLEEIISPRWLPGFARWSFQQAAVQEELLSLVFNYEPSNQGCRQLLQDSKKHVIAAHIASHLLTLTPWVLDTLQLQLGQGQIEPQTHWYTAKPLGAQLTGALTIHMKDIEQSIFERLHLICQHGKLDDWPTAMSVLIATAFVYETLQTSHRIGAVNADAGVKETLLENCDIIDDAFTAVASWFPRQFQSRWNQGENFSPLVVAEDRDALDPSSRDFVDVLRMIMLKEELCVSDVEPPTNPDNIRADNALRLVKRLLSLVSS